MSKNLGFKASVEERELLVEFTEYEGGEYRHYRIGVELDSIHQLAVNYEEQIECTSNCCGSAWLVRDKNKTAGMTFVALYAPYVLGHTAAIIRADLLPEIVYGESYWHDTIKALHADANNEANDANTKECYNCKTGWAYGELCREHANAEIDRLRQELTKVRDCSVDALSTKYRG